VPRRGRRPRFSQPQPDERHRRPLDGGCGFLARIKNKPFVVREWNYCWPNRNRAAGMVEALLMPRCTTSTP
jgi:hypothetical protein